MTKSNNVKSNSSDSPVPVKQRTRSDSSSFLNSMFLSSTTLIIMTSFVVVAIIIMGWFVYVFSDNVDWIYENDQIISSAKKANADLQKANVDLQNKKAETQVLLQNQAIARKELNDIQGQLVTVQTNTDIKNKELSIFQKKKLEAEETLESLLSSIPDERDKITKLNLQHQKLKAEVRKKRSEFNELDGKVLARTNQLSELTTKLDAIKSAESTLSKIETQLGEAVTQLKETNSEVQSSASNLEIQVVGLAKQNKRLLEEVGSLSANNQAIGPIATDLNPSSDAIKSIAFQLQESQKSLRESSDSFVALVGQLTQTQSSIQTLRQTIDDSTESIEQMGESTDTFQKLNRDFATAQIELERLTVLITQFEDTVPENLTPSGDN